MKSLWLWAFAIICYIDTVKFTLAIDVDKSNYRLPNETYPEHYDIKLTTNVHTGEKAFQGEIIIDIVVVSPTNKIILHARELNISKATITNQLTPEPEDLSIDYELEREFLTFTRRNGKEFSAQTNWKLTIIYSGELQDDKTGVYLSKYKHDDGNDHYLAGTYFERINARYAFPCYDEPNKRANFTITINHSPTYTAISNMPANGRLSSANQTVFLTTPPMSTYTVGFIISDFKHTEVISENLPQRIYSRPNAQHFSEQFFSKIQKLMKFTSDYFNVKFMLPKLDHVGLPESIWGGGDNWGIVACDENYIVTDWSAYEFHSTYNNLQSIASAIISQWFGNYVGISSWEYRWIKSGITELYGHKALDHFYPEWKVWHMFQIFYHNYPLDNEIGYAGIQLTNYLQTREEFENQNEFLSNAKSTALLRMWNNALTDKVFQKGLRNFLEKNQYQAVGEEGIFNALQAAIKEENYEIPATINDMFSTWTHQRGYPILTVSRNYNDGTFTIKQETYYNNETIKDSQTWYVPINYAVASNPNFSDTKVTHYLLNVAETKFADVKISNNDWLILNKQSIGYYRVNYDKMNWNLIIQSLIENPSVIDSHNRAQVLSDAIALWESDRLDTSILFEIFTYLKQEDELVCWVKINQFFTNLKLYLQFNEKYDDFRVFFAEQLSPNYEKFRLVVESRDNYYQSKVASMIKNLACIYELKECIQDNYNKFKNYLKQDQPSADVAPCFAMQMSDDALFDTAYKKLFNTEDENWRNKLIEALSCHRNEVLIKQFLKTSIDKSNNLKNQERYSVLSLTCYRSPVTFKACIDFLNENWDDYGNLKSDAEDSNPLNDQLVVMASKIYEQNQETQLMALVDKVKNSKHVSPHLETVLKNVIVNNMKLSKKYREEIIPQATEYNRKAFQRE